MYSKKYQITWKTFLVPALGLLAFFSYVYIFNVDILRVAAKAKTINIYLYMLAATAVILDTLCFSAAWYFLLKFLAVKLSMIKSFLFVWFGIFFDTLIPAESISGELSKVYLVTREQSGTTGKVAASLVTQRLISMTINEITLLVGAVVLWMQGHLFGIILAMTFLTAFVILLFLTLIFLLSINENWILRTLDIVLKLARFVSRGRWKLIKLKEVAIQVSNNFVCAMKDFSQASRTIAVASLFSLLSWILNMSVFYLVLLSIGYSGISLSAILVIYSIYMTVKAIPLGIPFEVGLPEITLTTLFIVVGVPPEISATATIMIRLLTLWLKFFIGFAVQQWIGITTIAVTQTIVCEEKVTI